MTHALLTLILLGCIALTSGCKLAVLVVEGGIVLSQDSGICAEGAICIHQVADTRYSERFVAVPLPGWYFHQWQQGEGFLCSGYNNPGCELALEQYAGVEPLEELVASSQTFYLMPVFRELGDKVIAAGRDLVYIDDRQWLQPDAFTGYSYEQISRVCPRRGTCSGTLPDSSIDLDGYTWASSAEVQGLFNLYRGLRRPLLDDFGFTLAERDDMGRVVNFTLYGMVSDAPANGTTGVCVATGYDGQEGADNPEEHSIQATPLNASRNAPDIGAWFWKMQQAP